MWDLKTADLLEEHNGIMVTKGWARGAEGEVMMWRY